MASRDKHAPPTNVPAAECTTNDEDQRQAAQLQERLRQNNNNNKGPYRARSKELPVVPHVQIDDGAHKYVLIQAERIQEPEYFVTSRRGASYHRNAATPLIEQLEAAGYMDIRVKGGGRISYNADERRISIFGFSYSFGQADHQRSKEVILADERYKDCEVTFSNDGY